MQKKTKTSSWDDAEKWYSECVGEKGHYYHQEIVLPKTFQLLQLKKQDSLLDLGCGQGVLARHLPEGVLYYGFDLSAKLIAEAKRQATRKPWTFLVGNACTRLPLEKTDFDAVCFILSLQNMEFQDKAIANGARCLKKGGKLVIVLNHPCFRIPRQSSWGVDTQAKLQYRRINRYMTPLTIPLKIHPSQGELSGVTYSYHHPLSDYTKWVHESGLSLLLMEEWCSNKKSEGAKARMEDRSRSEIPLFLTIVAIKT